MEILEFIQKHWSIVMAVVGLVWTYFWLTMDSKYAKKTDIKALSDKVDGNDKRVTLLEKRLEDLPTSKEFAHLEKLMTEIKGDLKGTNATVNAMSHQVGLLVEEKILHNKE